MVHMEHLIESRERFKPRVAVFVVLISDDGEILLQRRYNTGYRDGYYDFSASGHLEEGESIKECAVREAKEEIGVDIDEDNLQLIHVNQNYVDDPYINFTFVCREWKGEPRICEPEKCDDLRFFGLEDFPEKCTINVKANKKDDLSRQLSFSYVAREEDL